jgi:hypothetical protein
MFRLLSRLIDDQIEVNSQGDAGLGWFERRFADQDSYDLASFGMSAAREARQVRLVIPTAKPMADLARVLAVAALKIIVLRFAPGGCGKLLFGYHAA